MPLTPSTIQGLLMMGFTPAMTDDIFASTVSNAVNTYCTLMSGLKTACAQKQDATIALGIASAVTTYLTTAVIKIEGTATCKGAQGVGIMS